MPGINGVVKQSSDGVGSLGSIGMLLKQSRVKEKDPARTLS